jgi:hypothetical protein
MALALQQFYGSAQPELAEMRRAMKSMLRCLAVAAITVAPAAAYAQANGTPAQAPTVTRPTGQPAVNADAAALADFKKRIDAYVDIHNKAAKASTPLKTTNQPAEIVHAQEALLQQLRAARPDAKPGDIFTPEIKAAFRKILRPEMKGEDGQDAKEILKDDAPPAIPLKINAKYPEGATRPTVPAKILASLPTLPEQVEYRIADGHLVLLDAKAWMVIDYIANAVPAAR